jgi:hypothetical protein
MNPDELKTILEQALHDLLPQTNFDIAPRWQEATVEIVPNNDTQPKKLEIETFFKKITSIRDSLRILEHKLNNNKQLSLADKASFQGYVTKCYGSLTTFNFLFADEKDKFRGSSTESKNNVKENMNYHAAQKKIGLNEYD